MPKTRGSHRADERQRRCSQCAFSPGKLIPNKFPFRGLSFSGHACRISRAHTWAPLLSRLTFRSPLYIVCASFSPGRPQNLSPEFLPCPRPLLAAVGDAVPSARQCPRPWLALYETLSRARAAGLHPSFQPRSNRSPPCGRCRVAASTVLRFLLAWPQGRGVGLGPPAC